MNKIKCESCRGTGEIKKFKHIENGICFTCAGQGFYTVNNETLQKIEDSKNRFTGTYFTFENGKITGVINSNTIVNPTKKKGDNLVAEQLEVGGNVIYYRTQYNSFTKKSEVWSASFKHLTEENTLEIITRLIKCNIKNTIELFKAFGDSEEKLKEYYVQLESAENEALKQLKGYGY